MKFYCGECLEEIGNCPSWCGERQREESMRTRQAADALGITHQSGCKCVACAALERAVRK